MSKPIIKAGELYKTKFPSMAPKGSVGECVEFYYEKHSGCYVCLIRFKNGEQFYYLDTQIRFVG